MNEARVLWSVIELRERYEKRVPPQEPDPPGGHGYDKYTRTGAQENIDGEE